LFVSKYVTGYQIAITKIVSTTNEMISLE